jgi:aspartate/methionine/tyrosine aminotransferase
VSFSRRTAVAREPNRLSLALERARATADVRLLDLTVSNPTTAGLPYDEAAVLAAFADPRSLTYRPLPFGMESAREAVAQSYAEAGIALDPARVVLTASTSEAYGHLFKLLCDPGDEVLVPAPSYPLFDLLARFEGVTLVPYRLAYDGAWHIDRATVEAAVTSRTRAVLVVSPNNPTGSYLKRGELHALGRLGLPIVSDEVFAPFALKVDAAIGDGARATSVLEVGGRDASERGAPLVFALNGLSKLAALPQMKLGWIAVGGSDRARVEEALARLELLADAYLSVGTPVQLALPALLRARGVTVSAIQARLATNLATLRAAVAGTPVSVLDVEGGWYATLRLPTIQTEEEWALALLEGDGVYVHPGHFFEFAEEAYLVVSLLTAEATLREGVARVVARVTATAAGTLA